MNSLKVSSHSAWELMPKGSYDIRLCEYQSIDTRHIERVSQVLGQIIESQLYLAFNEDVEEEFHDEYWKTIAYPTCLRQIKNRTESSYYRSIESLLWEVNLLHVNCAKFNGTDDQASNGLYSTSLQLVSVKGFLRVNLSIFFSRHQ